MELIRVPKVAEAVTEGTVSCWHVKVGDRVEPGTPLVEMITEKAEADLESPSPGRVAMICAAERSTLPVGYVLCVLAEEGENIENVSEINQKILAQHRSSMMGEVDSDQKTFAGHEDSQSLASGSVQVRATPAARRAARKAGVDLAEVGSVLGIVGRISDADVKKFIERSR
jgi:pyruvate dehydrogenase E2 component (dihydrolipoyllysine-residue acetyltransferase)